MIDTTQIQELARLGAEARIKEVTAEIEAIRRMFPGIEGGADKSPARAKVALPALAKLMDPGKTRTRSAWSAEKRNAVSLRMKKYWAGKRKAEAKKSVAA